MKRNLKSWGESRTRLHRIWAHMKSRCNNPKSHAYHHYGGRGIRVCKEWLEFFIIFRTWALANGYNNNLTIDRVDSNKGYNPNNCQWLTRAENCRKAGKAGKGVKHNKKIKGKEIKTI